VCGRRRNARPINRPREIGAVGQTLQVTNLAARMQTVAAAGGIAISEDTRRLVEGYFELRAMGPTVVKGLDAPVNAYEVTGLGPLRGHFEAAAGRGLTKFVGREREIAELKRALELARSGHGQTVAAVAEAGTGKSRLVHEFKAALPAECKLLEAYSVSHGKASAWLPVLELLRGYFGLQDADEPPTRREKVRTTLSALDSALSDTLPYLLGLLGIQDAPDPFAQMDPQIRRRRTLEAIRRIILRESLKQPIVVIFEDLHWIDGETQALLDLLVDSVAGARILLLANYRPEYRHEWSGKSHYTQLRLDPLGGESAAAMLTALLGDGAELETIKRLIAERTGGNPFFMEEMVQALFDQGALKRNGVVKVVRPLSQLRLPRFFSFGPLYRPAGACQGHDSPFQTLPARMRRKIAPLFGPESCPAKKLVWNRAKPSSLAYALEPEPSSKQQSGSDVESDGITIRWRRSKQHQAHPQRQFKWRRQTHPRQPLHRTAARRSRSRNLP
jgi:hypothetical protein